MLALLLAILPARAADDPTAFLAEVQGDLLRAYPDCTTEVRGPYALHLTCGKTELDLYVEQLYGACQAAEAACDGAKQKWLGTVAASFAPNPALRLDDVVPVVRNAAWLTALPEAAVPQVMTDPLVGDLVVVWMVDSPDTARTLREKELPELGVARAGLAAAALPGLRRQLASVGDQDAGGYHIVGGSYYTSSVLLDPDWWRRVGGGQPVYAVVPTNDVVLYTTSDRARDHRKMSREADRFARQAKRTLSERVYVWRDGGWAEE